MPFEDSDPIENFAMQLEIARLQASGNRFADAYQTLAVAYENLIEQHEEAINQLIALRKKVSLS